MVAAGSGSTGAVRVPGMVLCDARCHEDKSEGSRPVLSYPSRSRQRVVPAGRMSGPSATPAGRACRRPSSGVRGCSRTSAAGRRPACRPRESPAVRACDIVRVTAAPHPASVCGRHSVPLGGQATAFGRQSYSGCIRWSYKIRRKGACCAPAAGLRSSICLTILSLDP
jgi:hypothetical protein